MGMTDNQLFKSSVQAQFSCLLRLLSRKNVDFWMRSSMPKSKGIAVGIRDLFRVASSMSVQYDHPTHS